MRLKHWIILLALVAFGFLLYWAPQASARPARYGSKGKARVRVSDPPPRHRAVAAKRSRKKSARPARTTRTRRGRQRYRRVSFAVSNFADSAAGDSLDGEDLVVREAALFALGPYNGTVVVTDPQTGRILSIINQKLALSGGEPPCSTIKLPVALAALSEGIINRDTQVRLSRRWSLNLTEALAHSNNQFFEALGVRIGFQKLSLYAHQFGFGELAGFRIPGEQVGTFPEEPARFGGVARMSSFGEKISVTPLQLAAFVSAIANGGTLYYLQYPRTPADIQDFQPMVKRQLDVDHLLPEIREGMMAAVDHGTGQRASLSFETVLGKTGTCSHAEAHLGWFASYAGKENSRVAVVVLLRGGNLVNGPTAAEVAGRVYRNLYERNYYLFADVKPTATGVPQ